MPNTSVAAACRKQQHAPGDQQLIDRLGAEHRPDHELCRMTPNIATITTAAAIAAISGQWYCTCR